VESASKCLLDRSLWKAPQETSGTCRNCKLRPFLSFWEWGMWTQLFPRSHTANAVLDVQNYMFGSRGPCHIESNSRQRRLWVILATMFTGHESLPLFLLGSQKRSCVPHRPTHCAGVAGRNWSCHLRDHGWHVAWKSWQFVVRLRWVHEVKGSHTEHVSTWRPHAHKVSMKMNFHSSIIRLCTS
jgi:hypothetical protein